MDLCVFWRNNIVIKIGATEEIVEEYVDVFSPTISMSGIGELGFKTKVFANSSSVFDAKFNELCVQDRNYSN